MNESLRGAIEEAEKALATKMAEVKQLRTTINQLNKMLGQAPPYADDDLALEAKASKSTKIRRDTFFGKQPIPAIRVYLEMMTEPKTPDEILAGLAEGGFDFQAVGWTGASKLRALAITLSKNTAVFTRLNDGYVGLTKWYPTDAIARRKERRKAEEVTEGEKDDAPEDETPVATKTGAGASVKAQAPVKAGTSGKSSAKQTATAFTNAVRKEGET